MGECVDRERQALNPEGLVVLLWHQGSELSPNFDLEAELMFARGWALQPGLLVSSWWQGVFPRKPTSCRTNKCIFLDCQFYSEIWGLGGKKYFSYLKKHKDKICVTFKYQTCNLREIWSHLELHYNSLVGQSLSSAPWVTAVKIWATGEYCARCSSHRGKSWCLFAGADKEGYQYCLGRSRRSGFIGKIFQVLNRHVWTVKCF